MHLSRAQEIVSKSWAPFCEFLFTLVFEIFTFDYKRKFSYFYTHMYSIPTRQFLAQFRFRPWRGVFCSDAYLNDIEYAMKFTQNLLHAYADLSIEPLVESALRSDSEISLLRRLVVVQT